MTYKQCIATFGLALLLSGCDDPYRAYYSEEGYSGKWAVLYNKEIHDVLQKNNINECERHHEHREGITFHYKSSGKSGSQKYLVDCRSFFGGKVYEINMDTETVKPL